MIGKKQIQTIHTLLPAVYKQDKELKANLIYQFTEDNTKTSTKDLTEQQADELIWFLKTGKRMDMSSYALFDNNNQQHLYMLSLCHQIGWVDFNDKLNRMVADLNTLGTWLQKYGYLHKALKQYTNKELPKLVSQFENFVK